MEKGNVLKIASLPSDWVDKDIVLLHACFQLLKDYIEREESQIPIDWNQTQEYQSAKTEIYLLYEWWINRPDETNELDRQQFEIDTEMLVRLIKVRGFLWT